MNFFVASYGKEKNIYQCNVTDSGNIAILNRTQMQGYPSYLYSNHKEIIVALKKKEMFEKGGVCILDEQLKLKKSFYHDDSYTHVFQDEQLILVASYHQGHILIIDRKSGVQKKIFYDHSKIHQVGKINENEYYAIDLQNQKIYFFTILPNLNYHEIQTILLPQHHQPRHLVAQKNHLYILCENTGYIFVYQMIKQQYKFQQKINTSDHESKNEMCSAIKIDHHFLYSSNRKNHKITIFQIHADGNLEKKLDFDTMGKTPRDFLLLKKGKYLLVGNEDDDNLTLFEIDYQTNQTKKINQLMIPKPVCIAK